MLSDRDKTILDIESRRYRFAGAKDAAIRDELDVTPTRYYQMLGVLLRDPAALQFAPLTVKRLLRLEAARREQRTPR